MSSGRTAAVGVLAVVGLCCGVGALESGVCVGGRVMVGSLMYPGCDDPVRPPGITVAELAGVYTSGYGATLELDSDGTLTAFDFRDSAGEYEPGTNPRMGQVSASGRWRLVPTGDTTGDVVLDFAEEPQPFQAGLRIGGSRTSPRLYQNPPDADACHLYRFNRD